MKYLIIFFVTCSCLLYSCKKGNGGSTVPNYNDSTRLNQVVIIKITATKPSPWDIANLPPADSVLINQIFPIGTNADGVDMDIFQKDYPGLGFSYKRPGNSLADPLIAIGPLTIPSVNTDFTVNNTYEHTTISDALGSPLALGLTDFKGLGHYFNDTIPSDGSSSAPVDTTYCKVIFTNKFTSNINNRTVTYADGVISGYSIRNYGNPPSAKYIQRWDFYVYFKDLAYNNN